MKTMPITPTLIFPRHRHQEHAGHAALGVRLVWDYSWAFLLPTGVLYSKKTVNFCLTLNLAFYTLRMVCVSQAEAQPWADVFFTSKFVRCQIGGAAAIATLLNFLNDISKSLYSPCVWLAFTSTLKSSSAYYPAKN